MLPACSSKAPRSAAPTFGSRSCRGRPRWSVAAAVAPAASSAGFAASTSSATVSVGPPLSAATPPRTVATAPPGTICVPIAAVVAKTFVASPPTRLRPSVVSAPPMSLVAGAAEGPLTSPPSRLPSTRLLVSVTPPRPTTPPPAPSFTPSVPNRLPVMVLPVTVARPDA